jgi:uncharacterized protein (TIGR03435 family)
VSSAGTLPPEIAAQIHAPSGPAAGRQMTMKNQTMADFARYLEQSIGQPVADQTGTTNRFDFTLQVQARQGETSTDALKRAILEQLGLVIIPVHTPVEMLVVDRAK